MTVTDTPTDGVPTRTHRHAGIPAAPVPPGSATPPPATRRPATRRPATGRPATGRPAPDGAGTTDTGTTDAGTTDTGTTGTGTDGADAAGRAGERGRDALLDVLRAVALVRVFVWHAFPAKWLTGIAAMPVMFFVAGTMLPRVSGWRDYGAMLRRRGRRLLVPFWAYGAVLFTALFVLPPLDPSLTGTPEPRWSALSWLVPLADPSGNSFQGGWLASHLWYLRAYLWIVVAAPLVVALARRAGRGTAAFAAGAVLLALGPRYDLPLIGSGSGRVIFGDLVCYGLFAALGVVYTRRRNEGRVPPPWPAAALVAALAGAGAAAYVVAEGLPAEGVNGAYPAIVLTGVAWLAAIQAAEGPLRRLADRAGVARAAKTVSGRALSVYLWHPAGIVVARTLLGPTEGPVGGATTLAVAASITLLFVAAFGRLEDLARGARGALGAHRYGAARQGHDGAEDRRERVPASARATAVLTAAAVAGFAVAQVRPAGASDDGTIGGRAGLAPSYREALRNDAFSEVRSGGAPAALPDLLAARGAAGDGTGGDAASADGGVSGRAAAGEPAAVASGAATDPPVVVRPDFDEVFEAWRAAHPEIGTVAVTADVGGSLWKAEGFRDPERPHHKVDDTYAIFSVTKTFTAALALQAMERGELALDEPVPDIDGVDAPPHPVTPRHLLTHTTGLIDYTQAEDFDPDERLGAAEAVNLSTRSPQRSWPGNVVHYANTNFLYLQLVLEEATGRPFEELMAELVGRVGLRYTRLVPPTRPGRVGGGAGGIRSSVPDLAQWATALFTPGRVLQPSSLALMTTLDDQNMGLGTWPICPCWTDETGAKRYTAIGHHVGSGGVFFYPASGLTVAVRIEPQSNEAGGMAAELGTRLSERLLAAGGR